jgi:hypothetical protein
MQKILKKSPVQGCNFREGSLDVGAWLTHWDRTRCLGHWLLVTRCHDSVSGSRYAVCRPDQGQQGFPLLRCHAGHVCSLQDFLRFYQHPPPAANTQLLAW